MSRLKHFFKIQTINNLTILIDYLKNPTIAFEFQTFYSGFTVTEFGRYPLVAGISPKRRELRTFVANIEKIYIFELKRNCRTQRCFSAHDETRLSQMYAEHINNQAKCIKCCLNHQILARFGTLLFPFAGVVDVESNFYDRIQNNTLKRLVQIMNRAITSHELLIVHKLIQKICLNCRQFCPPN